jgi:lipoprotein NlpI
MGRLGLVLASLLLVSSVASAEGDALESKTANQLYRTGLEAFAAGDVDLSCRAFDLQLERRPADRPAMWQRGISLYYANRLKDCVAQFESHRTENPDDAENAAWHYLCVAALKGEKKARARLLPARDGRIPMMAVHRLYAGETTVDGVFAAAAKGGRSGEFYAHLYVALWHESRGEAGDARRHLEQALEGPSIEHYMEIVARVHLERIRSGRHWAVRPGS